MHESISTATAHLFRQESGKMVAVLTRLLGIQQLDTAQDLVQDTLLQAMAVWSIKGLPDNPAAWLHSVARNKAIDFIRREKRFRSLTPQYAALLQSEWSLHHTVEHMFLRDEISDSQLRMMFACCHPSIPVASQVAIMLKTLCGLSAAEIARAFLTGEDTITKRIFRAREKMRTDLKELEVPQGDALPPRLDAVLQALYLLFNEGYLSSNPDFVIREELCREAMRLCLLLTEHPQTKFPRTLALMSLFCFQASRLGTRLDDQGNIILLKYQDRTKWFRPLIQKGFDYLDASSEPFEISPFQLEAGIASLHAAAPDFAATDWKTIYQLYQLLYNLRPGPVVAMNKAIAAGYAISPQQGIAELHAITELNQHYLYHAALGELLNEAGKKEEALHFFSRALALAQLPAEQALLRQKMEQCG